VQTWGSDRPNIGRETDHHWRYVKRIAELGMMPKTPIGGTPKTFGLTSRSPTSLLTEFIAGSGPDRMAGTTMPQGNRRL